MEELVGEIWDEYDDFEEELVKKDDNTYEVSGDYNIYDLMEELDEDNRSFESDYNTVSGWVLEQLEHIPKLAKAWFMRIACASLSLRWRINASPNFGLSCCPKQYQQKTNEMGLSNVSEKNKYGKYRMAEVGTDAASSCGNF